MSRVSNSRAHMGIPSIERATITIRADVRDRVRAMAKARGVSMAGWLEDAIAQLAEREVAL